MTIGIILHPYGENKPAGLGRAIYEITKSLIELDQKNHYIIYLRKKPTVLPKFHGTNWEIKILDYRFFWLDIGLWGEKLDVCIFNTPIMPFFVRPKKSIIITHDYAYNHFGKSQLLKRYHAFSLKKANHIIAVSEYTKQETIKIFNTPEEKIRVIYWGFKSFCASKKHFPSPFDKKFFLFVGVIKKRKNVLGVVKAYHQLKNKMKLNHVLVIVGKGSGLYFDNVISYIKENNLINNVSVVGSVSDDELTNYYQNAEALVFPSFIEGFGFPVLEAMSCGTPVITSNESSLPEVAGDAALLVDPHNIEDIASAMEKILSDPKTRSSLITKGYKQTEKFTWEKTARGYLDIIESV